ncbi:hypothetical protein G3576_13425 [Roseomonas stagni]|uniref:KANL3/Tex30 alpha/beta hydrolase-like domain-containing protein n=1 Tax=Falsiroseomonas algicola TaxID=2716930 RepID=A0A6M1LLX9_9PROT|nr:alpha/beta family hydrolase [Falsiroseomonas algicola]NGM21019.1 hypothetical protein [Falsiroseomonas algicola]
MIVPAGRPGPAFYLAGDSFPDDVGVERALAPRLGPHFDGWVGQAALADIPGGFDPAIAARAAQLEAALPEGPALRRVVLIGRSSGARVVTEVACRRPVQAVICLGYPFRRPGGPLEPARFAHLSGLAVPTLILQGTSDAYGTPTAARFHPLSPHIQVQALEADHRLRLAAPDWDAACRLILDFCAHAAAPHDLTG